MTASWSRNPLAAASAHGGLKDSLEKLSFLVSEFPHGLAKPADSTFLTPKPPNPADEKAFLDPKPS
jgi:hypothetical protein